MCNILMVKIGILNYRYDMTGAAVLFYYNVVNIICCTTIISHEIA